MLGGNGHLFKVKPCVVLRALQRCHKGLRSGLAGAVCKGAERAVNYIHARLYGHEISHVAGAGSVVRMQMYRHAYFFLHALYQRIRIIGQQQIRHVLYAYNVRAHLLQFLSHLNEVILVMHGADGVAYGGFAYSAVFLCILYGGFKIAHVVKSIKYPYDIDSVLYRLATELLHNVVGIMLIAQYILAAEKHLQFGIGQRLFKLSQPVPRILVEEAEACVKRGSAPALQ